MANLRKWSTTASGNASIAGGPATINFQEGQNPGTVNNSAREMMAQIRGIYTPDEWGWVEHSASASRASNTAFKLSGDQTTYWTAGRRWRLKSPSTTRYGAVVSSSYTSETTVTVTVDGGLSLSESHSLAALASITSNHIPDGGYVTSASLATALGGYLTSASAATALATYVTSNSMSAAIANFVTSNSASAMIATQVAAGAGGATVLGTIDTSSGASATLTSLTLTNYKMIQLIFLATSTSTANTILLGNSTSDDVTITNTLSNGQTQSGVVWVDLADGKGVAMLVESSGATNVGISFDSALSTATTTISLAVSSGSFDAGSVRVIGYR